MADPAPKESVDGAPAQRTGPGRILGADLPARIGAAVALMVGALGTAWAGGYWFGAFWLIAALLIGAAGAALANGARPPRLMAGAGVLYAGAMLVSVCLLRASRPPGGLDAIVWLFAVVWGTDVMAFFGGRLVGGPKLWPRLSPAKTWSGFGIGILCGAAAGLLAASAANSIAALFCFGLATGAVAQGGDLFESALKRRFGVKDSSGLIPGHGGLMDRLDGFTAAAISTAFVGAARYGIVNMAAGVFQW